MCVSTLFYLFSPYRARDSCGKSGGFVLCCVRYSIPGRGDRRAGRRKTDI
ncbi:hypothetical protein BACCAP_00354 [Pseudoflavonifractor capillosus ATCC 29799]|uniref:Uncharacterized protein n=1 Tax=Pseudoflavonifractor capillosus ATCC 29799 TaxID=411467 RepID=A6NQ84_9FIRM|nr:hypothetical protein BACCAP_00354 [Pseudoflavonifractor capillosus ATCC 29799]